MSEPWPMVPLGEVLREERQRIGSPAADGLPLLGVSNNRGLHRSTKDRIADMSRYFRVERGWFAYNPMRINVGSLGWAENDDLTGVISPDYVVFSCTDRIEPRLVYLFLKSRVGLDAINFETAGSVRERLYFDSLGRIRFPLPPLVEQRRIVARVEALAARIAEAKRLREEMTTETEALLKVEMRRVFSVDEQFPKTHLEATCQAIIDTIHSDPKYTEEGVPCVRSPDVKNGKLDLVNALKTDEVEYVRRTIRGEPHTDDIVFVRQGGGTGKAGIVEDGQRFSLGQAMMILRPDRGKVIPRFLLYQLLSPIVRDDQIKPCYIGTASPRINIGSLRKFMLYTPPLPEQRRIVAHLDALQAKVDALRALQAASAAELEALLPAVLAQAFRGEL